MITMEKYTKDVKHINKSIDDIKTITLKNYRIAMEDKDFAMLAYTLNLDESILMNYTSKLESTVKELKLCKGCEDIKNCKLELKGYIDFPKVQNNELIFSYTPCKYKKEELKNKTNTVFYETPKFLMDAKLSNIYRDDKAREEILKYIMKFLKSYPNTKGIYLYGSFGSGKSYILNALVNELSKKGNKCVSIYYPILLKKLKDSMANKNMNYTQIYNELEMCDCLLIDDIGAENNTPWARDEILGSLLQSRMDNSKITFFTSNFSLEELENHLAQSSNGTEKIKARRIIERIKQLSTPIALIGENKRDNN